MTVSEEVETLPAVFEHACRVYNRMEAEAELVECPDQGMSQQLVWTGHLTKLFADLHFSTPFYTLITRELKRMGCIAQKRRGGGSAVSQWYIRYAPTEELFREQSNITGNLSTKRATRLALLEQQVKDMARDQQRILEENKMIFDALREMEQHARGA